LVHTAELVQIGRLQRRDRKALIDITQDRLRLVELKPVMVECRDFGEGMSREMRLLPMRAKADLDKLMRNALLGEGQADTPHIGAARRAIDDRPPHFRSPSRPRIGRNMSTRPRFGQAAAAPITAFGRRAAARASAASASAAE